MAKQQLIVRGARQHNLKNVDVQLPRDRLIVFTGLSGSGKSSLAFDTIYAEGQRRYVESLSAYARQFLGQMDKPDVDFIEGLSPAISIDQKTTSRNPRSTVGTVTEIYDYLRLLFARIGKPHCHECGQPIAKQTVEQIVDRVMDLGEGTRLQILSPVVRGRKGEFKQLLQSIRREGFVRVRVNGELHEVTDEINLDKNKNHSIEIVVDRIIVREDIEGRLADSIETALRRADGLVLVNVLDGEDMLFSEKFACPDCGVSLEELTPRMFSFNSPFGACPDCDGLGMRMEFDPELVIDPTKSIKEGGLLPWASSRSKWLHAVLRAVCTEYGIAQNVPISEHSEEQLSILLHGTGTTKYSFDYKTRSGAERVYESAFEGLIPHLNRRHREARSNWRRREIERYMSARKCSKCNGGRLKPQTLAVTIGERNIVDVVELSIRKARDFFAELDLTERERLIAVQVLKEIEERLGFLVDVGLDYLTLDRAAGTLSGGEAQRIRLATQIGSQLVGVLYILDEPSIGLHQRDNERLLGTLRGLRDIGNTVIVVEHDEDTIRTADFIVDIGPGAGAHGGEIVAAGTLDEVMETPESVTGQYMSGKRAIRVPSARRQGNGKRVTVRGARENNLRDVDVDIPLGVFVCVTGVSGSGKSTLINEILYKRLAQALHGAGSRPGAHDRIEGLKHLDKVIDIDQSPIGRTPRSNPATYTGAFDGIRAVFAELPEAKIRGYKPGRFSFNVKGGRCEACSGDGIIKIEMHFLPDVYVPCEVCRGKRYNRETLEVKYKGKSIADVLAMRVEEAMEFFSAHPPIYRRLQTLYDVGLGYITLGQPATTLSGGEAQRVKLATELSRRSTGKTLYLLDEPTTGLHTADIEMLLDVLNRLVDGGDTVLVIEHNLDVIKTADHIIDLGPEGGDGGGMIVASGTPEEVATCAESHTGRFLQPVLAAGAEARRASGVQAAESDAGLYGAEADGAEAGASGAGSGEADGAEAGASGAGSGEADGAEADGAEADGAEADGAEADGAKAETEVRAGA